MPTGKEIAVFVADFALVWIPAALLFTIFDALIFPYREPPRTGFAIVGLAAGLAGWIAWRLLIHDRKTAQKSSPGNSRILIRILGGIFCLPIFLMVGWFTLVCISNTHPVTGKHVTAAECRGIVSVPENATDVSYFRTDSWTEFECTCTEKEFRKWANARWEVREITEPEQVLRYNPSELEIRNGLTASTRRPNGGGYQVVYDREAGRLYFQTNPR